MKQTIIKTFKSLTYNLKTLIYFEIIYRLLGVLIIFPIVRLLFLLSLKLSGHVYITNLMLVNYLFNPSTILILFGLLIIISIYIVIEMIYLALLFDLGHHETYISLKTFLIIGLRRVITTIKKYHIMIIFPAFLFFLIVEFFHIVGIVSTLSLPPYLVQEIKNMPILQFLGYAFGVMFVLAFIESIFSLQLFTIEKKNIKSEIKESMMMLKGHRLKIFFEFILLNIFLNIILYALYLLLIAIVALLIYITRGQELVLAFLLSIIYSIYIFIGLLASIILIPVNYALLSTWYYERRRKLGLEIKVPNVIKSLQRPINSKWLKRGLAITLLIIFALNVTSVLTIVRQSKGQFEYFNYSQIIAHRGASFDAPENTLAAIELAIEQGADYIEIDIRETFDLVPVLMHDSTLGRTTNDIYNRSVNKVTLETLKTLDAGSWFSSQYIFESVPTLEEVLILVKGRGKLFIELKVNSKSLDQSVVELIEEYDMVSDVKILSYSSNQLSSIKLLNQNIETVVLVVSFFGDIKVLVANANIDNYAFESSIVINNPNYIQLIHNAEKRVYVWTVNSEDKLRQVVNLDVDGIITDVPIIAREIAYQKNIRSVFANLLKELFAR